MGVEEKKAEHAEGRRLLGFARSAAAFAIIQCVPLAAFVWWLWVALGWRRSTDDWRLLENEWGWSLLFIGGPIVLAILLLRAIGRNVGLWWENRQLGRHLLGRTSGWRQALGVGLFVTSVAAAATAVNNYYNRNPAAFDALVQQFNAWWDQHRP